jgi:hypothetical protein
MASVDVPVVGKLELDHRQRLIGGLGHDHPVGSPLERFGRERPPDALAHGR